MNVLQLTLLCAAVAGYVLADVGAACAGTGGPVTKYVLTYSGPDSVWEIIRGPQRLGPKNGLPLAPGDCIALRAGPAGGTSTSQLTVISDGREVVVNRERPRYCIADEPPRNPVASAIARTFASLAGVFHSAEQSYNEHSTVPMTTRGGKAVPPVVPLLAERPQRIVSGNRALAVAWASGSPPYSVALMRAGRAQPLAVATTPHTRVRLEPVMFAPGTYHLTVTDAAHLAITSAFTAVPATAVPTASADVLTVLGDAETPADVRAAFDAARLMADGSGTWRFEAYQRVIDHANASALAERLIYDLESGG